MKKNSRLIDRQTKKANCAPIAVANAIAWRNYSDAYKVYAQMEPMMQEHGYDPETGVNDPWTHKVLAHSNIPFDTVTISSPRILVDALESGCGVLLAYYWRMEELRPLRKSRGHMVFVDDTEGAFLNAYNVNGNGADYIPTLTKYLSQTPGRIWVIDKRASRTVKLPERLIKL